MNAQTVRILWEYRFETGGTLRCYIIGGEVEMREVLDTLEAFIAVKRQEIERVRAEGKAS